VLPSQSPPWSTNTVTGDRSAIFFLLTGPYMAERLPRITRASVVQNEITLICLNPLTLAPTLIATRQGLPSRLMEWLDSCRCLFPLPPSTLLHESFLLPPLFASPPEDGMSQRLCHCEALLLPDLHNPASSAGRSMSWTPPAVPTGCLTV